MAGRSETNEELLIEIDGLNRENESLKTIYEKYNTFRNRQIFWFYIAIVTILLIANLGAIIDIFLHPGIAYFDTEHIIVGVSSAAVAGIILLLFLTYLAHLEKAITIINQTKEKLKDSEEHYQTLFEKANDGILYISTNANIIEVNESFAVMHGYTLDEIQKITLQDLDTPETAALITERIASILSGETPKFEVEHFHKDGHIFPLEVSANLVTIGNKKIIQSFHRDISERKLSERIIKETSEKWQATFDAIEDVIFLMDVDGKILQVNEASLTFLGKTKQDIVGRNCDEVMCYYDCHNTNCPVLKLKQSRQRETMILPFRDRYLKVIVDPVLNERNEVIGIVHIMTDITEKKNAEILLRQSEEDYRRLFEEHSAIQIRVDLMNGDIADANFAAANYFGWSREELRKMNITQVKCFPPEVIQNEIEKANKGEKIRFEFQAGLRDGSIRDVQVLSNSITAMNGKIYLHSIILDITDRKLAEQEINIKNAQLEKANAEKDKFFGIIAHDLRSPFTGLLGLSKVMASEINELTMEDIAKYCESIHKSAVKLNKLVENLLEWALLQKNKITYSPKELYLFEVVLESADAVKQIAQQKNITIHHTIPSDMKIFADEKMINSVLRNFLSNAVKFTRTGGEVFVKAREIENAMVEVEVTDTGVGMSPYIVANLFRLGENVSSTGTGGEPGTGLGLLLCKEFISKHGGTIRVESNEEKFDFHGLPQSLPETIQGKSGSTFFFNLPVSNR